MDRIKSNLILAGSVFAVCGMFLLPTEATNAADPLTGEQKKEFEKILSVELIFQQLHLRQQVLQFRKKWKV